MDDRCFDHRAVDHPKTVACPQCAATVELPRTEPHLVVGGRTIPPKLVSIRCSACRGRIYFGEVSEEERIRNAESDALVDEDDGA